MKYRGSITIEKSIDGKRFDSVPYDYRRKEDEQECKIIQWKVNALSKYIEQPPEALVLGKYEVETGIRADHLSREVYTEVAKSISGSTISHYVDMEFAIRHLAFELLHAPDDEFQEILDIPLEELFKKVPGVQTMWWLN